MAVSYKRSIFAEKQVSNAIKDLKISMLAANIDRSMLCLKQLVAGTPYSTQKKENFVFEEHFRFILKNIFYLCGFKVSEEQQMSAGRIDLELKPQKISTFWNLRCQIIVVLFQPHIKSFLVIMLMPMLHLLNLLSHLFLSLIGRVEDL